MTDFTANAFSGSTQDTGNLNTENSPDLWGNLPKCMRPNK